MTRTAHNKPLIGPAHPSNPLSSKYWCRDKATLNTGFGPTPEAAYQHWLERDSKRSTVARAGIWNKKGCLDWFRRGCPAISSYLGGRQIVSYLPHLDQLVLRG